jgi:hypothetical protein
MERPSSRGSMALSSSGVLKAPTGSPVATPERPSTSNRSAGRLAKAGRVYRNASNIQLALEDLEDQLQRGNAVAASHAPLNKPTLSSRYGTSRHICGAAKHCCRVSTCSRIAAGAAATRHRLQALEHSRDSRPARHRHKQAGAG